jgi:hypothetical protein
LTGPLLGDLPTIQQPVGLCVHQNSNGWPIVSAQCYEHDNLKVARMPAVTAEELRACLDAQGLKEESTLEPPWTTSWAWLTHATAIECGLTAADIPV